MQTYANYILSSWFTSFWPLLEEPSGWPSARIEQRLVFEHRRHPEVFTGADHWLQPEKTQKKWTRRPLLKALLAHVPPLSSIQLSWVDLERSEIQGRIIQFGNVCSTSDLTEKCIGWYWTQLCSNMWARQALEKSQGSSIPPCEAPPQDLCNSKYPKGVRGAGDVTSLSVFLLNYLQRGSNHQFSGSMHLS